MIFFSSTNKVSRIFKEITDNSYQDPLACSAACEGESGGSWVTLHHHQSPSGRQSGSTRTLSLPPSLSLSVITEGTRVEDIVDF